MVTLKLVIVSIKNIFSDITSKFFRGRYNQMPNLKYELHLKVITPRKYVQ